MSLSVRSRLTFSFSALFGVLLIPFLGAIYFFLSASLEADLRRQIIHDYSQIMIVFEEHPKWEMALEELYREEADEFSIQIRVLDSALKQEFVSYGLKENTFSFAESDLSKLKEGAHWSTGLIAGEPHIILTQRFFPKDRESHFCQIWKSKQGIIEITNRFLTIVLFGIPFIFGFSILVGLFFSKEALQPFDVIRQKADQIRADDLSARLPYPRNSDETHKLTDTLNRLLDRIEKSFDGMKRFTSDASHELRIPLTNLKGMIEVALRKKRTVDEYQADFKDALEEVERLNDLVRNLLVLARVDAKKLNLNKKKIDLSIFIQEFIKWINPLAQQKQINIHFKEAAPLEIYSDPDKLKQILLILVDNAFNNSAEGSSITISTIKNTDGVVISVLDTGKGIPSEYHEKIFERFFRLDDSRDRKEGGTGLGLSIARSIAEAHNGKLTVESAAGKGSTFHLFLPKT